MKTHKAFAKVNIFLKITGTRGDYHEISSRFMLTPNLYDELCFVPKKTNNNFELIGNFNCNTKENTLYKVYQILINNGQEKVKIFMQNYALKVTKNIPSFAGFGGGSSDGATLFKMFNEELNLGLNTKELASLGLKIGADFPFFIYGYSSANVSGIGEIVKEFKEDTILFSFLNADIKCSTPLIYETYRKYYFNLIDEKTSKKLEKTSSKLLLKKYTMSYLNDLYDPALHIEPSLATLNTKNYFFSGSGSTFFKPKEF